ncbi:MAG TPA: hypothetical protein PLP01_08890 [Phycisphaerae bacterium]|nr:hypothetical protein [Phycisphaerae bacterium]
MNRVLAWGCLVALAAWACPVAVTGQEAAQDASATKTMGFEGEGALAGWTVTGPVATAAGKGRDGQGAALTIGSGGKALLKLRDADGSGKVELWVYDDLTSPENPRAATRPGPRWGLVQKDGHVLAVGILYASYLGGNEGYTATGGDGDRWYDQLQWLGVKRAPAAWRKWTFDFDTEKGLRVLVDGRDLNAAKRFDATKAGLVGFNGVVIYGDSGGASEQTLLVDDVSVTLGGPVTSVPQPRPEAPTVKGPDPWTPIREERAPVTAENAPATPKLDELEQRPSVTQHGITWTFEKPSPVGRFVNGDWYVVGPVTVTAIDPKPLYGEEIPEIELDARDLKRPATSWVRNGFMLNPPAAQKESYDSGIQNFFEPGLIQRLPATMKPGDSLVSTISMPKGMILKGQMLRTDVQRGKGDSSPIRTAAVLTCVAEPQPADAFRPGYCDRTQKIYLARNLKRDLLPRAERTANLADVGLYVRFTQRPWLSTGFFGFDHPVENMPQYGLEYGRVAGIAALLLCTDLKPEEKEPLLINYVQVGIDLGSIARAGHPGWEAFGGHGSGRKIPIVFAGLVLGDDELANVNRSFPQVSFGEDEQTEYGPCWTGATVTFAGHRAIDARTGVARPGSGPYEHRHPKEWDGIASGEARRGDRMSESYRRCCTSVGWVAQSLAMHLMKAQAAWGHNPFFDYVDRWMYEDDAEFVKAIKEATGADHSPGWARQGQTWDAFVNEMWAKHRTGPGMPPTDGWKQPKDFNRYEKSMELLKEKQSKR